MAKPVVEVGRWDQGGPGRIGSSRNNAIKGLEALAWLLDSSIQIPGTRFRVGLDAIIGLIPVVGDLIGAALSTYILTVAARIGVPRITLLRMGFNVTLEAVVGIVPVAGDIFDFAWKANQKNVELLRAHMDHPSQARRGDWLFAGLLLVLVVALLALLGWAGWVFGSWVIGLL